MTEYRLMKEKGGSKYWVQTALFNIWGLRIFRSFIGKEKMFKSGTHKIKIYFDTESEAFKAIAEILSKELKYKASTAYRGEWQ